jgi:GntR family transcriptional regulator/MocR family aminotransferase
MYLELDGRGALYEQLARSLKSAIVHGRIGPGKRLPATRELASELGLSRNTVLTAYELLCDEELASSRPGSGTYVAPAANTAPVGRAAETLQPQSRYAARLRKLGPIQLRAAPAGTRYDLQYGEPLLNPPLLSRWRSELANAAMRSDMRYAAAQGLPELRQAVCGYLARRRGVIASADDVIIVSGTQQALSLVARVVLDEGDSAVLEDPHYPLALHALRAHGARIVHTPVDEDGLVTAALPQRSPRLVFTTPSHQFPSGAVMSIQRRAQLLQYAVDHHCWIFEDDYDAEFRYESRPIPALRSLDTAGRVVYAGSFSKALFPSLRLGYIVCPASLRTDLVDTKRLDDMGCPAIEQAAMARFIESGRFDTHLRKATAELRRRRSALLAGLQRHAGDLLWLRDSRAGMHVVGWLPKFSYEQLAQLMQLAASRGLGLHAIHPLFKVAPPYPGLLIGFAGLSVTQITSATKLLGGCLRELV